MRFIHTSDWHLGRLFHGKHLTEDQAYVLEQFVALVAEVKPAVIIIAGDIYDRAVPPIEAVELLDNVISKILLEQKVPIIMIAGNHDSSERLGFASKLLSQNGLHVYGNLTKDVEPVILTDEHGPVYFLPFTYAEPALVRAVHQNETLTSHELCMDFLVQKSLDKVPAKARRVAIAHGFIAGSSESESERPLSVGGSSNISSNIFKKFHYTALGHLHNSQTAGDKNICYSGSLLKYSFDEYKQEKGINIVDLDATGDSKITKVSLQPQYDVKKIQGKFIEILKDDLKFPPSTDYMAVVLEDDKPILDIHGQLEKKYPNLLQIERINLQNVADITDQADYRNKSEQELFEAFFEQMTGNSLDNKEVKEFSEALEELLAKEREAKI